MIHLKTILEPKKLAQQLTEDLYLAGETHIDMVAIANLKDLEELIGYIILDIAYKMTIDKNENRAPIIEFSKQARKMLENLNQRIEEYLEEEQDETTEI